MSDAQSLCGIIPVNKPSGWTSFDCIAKLRGILHIKKLGHAGTLDPMATGVLPVFVGKATRACDILPFDRKSYTAGFKLGITTDTQDITGSVLSQSDMAVTKEKLDCVVESFVGEIMQLPPMYSAVSVGGKRLYELAREGKTVEREKRPREIFSLEVTAYNEQSREGMLEICCQKGTYVRTLINDIGEKIGCYGTMTSLIRTMSNGFDIKACYTIEQLSELSTADKIGEIIMPVDEPFKAVYKSIKLDERCTPIYKNGVKFRPEQVGINGKQCDGEIFCIYGFDGDFLGVAQVNKDKNEIKSVKNFY